MIHFNNELFIITGGSSGIGLESANLLVKLGARVVIVARGENRLKEIVQDSNNIETNSNSNSNIKGKMFYRAYDFSNIYDIKELIDSIVSEHGNINGLVHCAGMGVLSSLRDMDYDKLKAIFDVHFFAAYELIRNLCDKRKSKDLSIVLISSISESLTYKGLSPYATAKGALSALARSLVQEIAPLNARINSILPGILNTNMTKDARDFVSFEILNEINTHYPLKHGRTLDIAYLIAFLLSPCSSWISGENIHIDGGRNKM